MSLWTDLGSFFSGSSDLLGFAIQAGATIGSAFINADANTEAARIASNAAAAQAAAIREGNEAAQQRFDDLAEQTQVGRDALRGIVVSPEGLTPEQQLQKEDLDRLTIRGLDAGGIRGSGRATVAAVRRVGEGFTNTALQTNQDRRDAASRFLTNINTGAIDRSADLDTATGVATGRAISTGGQTEAQTTLADARATGNTLADLASLTARTLKARRSKQAKTKKPFEEEDEDE